MIGAIEDYRIVLQFEVQCPIKEGGWRSIIACETKVEAEKYASPSAGHRIVMQYELRQKLIDGERRVLARDTYEEAEEALHAEVNPTRDLHSMDLEVEP